MTQMYKNKFVLCITQNNVPQAESSNGLVEIPFNSEYTIRCRNKHDVQAVVEIWVDGEKISGNGFIIPPKSFIDIERPLDNNHKFKFVDVDNPDAIDHGKNHVAKSLQGLIRARFYLEDNSVKTVPDTIPMPTPVPYPVPMPYPVPYPRPYNPWKRRIYPEQPWYPDDWSYRGPFVHSTYGISTSDVVNSQILSVSDVDVNIMSSLSGITVEGEISDQNFGTQSVNYNQLQYTELSLRIVGKSINETKEVKTPSVSKPKPRLTFEEIQFMTELRDKIDNILKKIDI